jgi:plasmid stabilization system protein ParE
VTAWTLEWTPRARQDAERIAAWWAKNRGTLPELLQRELADATERIRGAPGIGAPHDTPTYGGRVRRVVLPKTGYLLFYWADDSAHRIHVLRLWSSLRRKAPRFPAVR